MSGSATDLGVDFVSKQQKGAQLKEVRPHQYDTSEAAAALVSQLHSEQ